MPNSGPAWVTTVLSVVTINNIPVPTPGNATQFTTLQTVVPTAGTPVRLVSGDVPVPAGRKLTMIAKPGNTGVIYFANTQAECVAGTRFDGLAAGLAHSFLVQNANEIWIDASVSGEGVSFYVEA
jgi:hypothetical protein